MKKIMHVILFFLVMITAVQLNAHPYVYVAVRPVRPNVVVVRPACPGPRHVWVDGDWVWNAGVHNYVWNEGRWVMPEPYSKWIPGHWRNAPQGYYWVPGHWKRY